MKIYTKSGDLGETKLFDGTPVSKDHLCVGAYGEVDELNSVLGAAAAVCEESSFIELLLGIQKQLFALGAELADPKFDTRKSKKPSLSAEWVSELERTIDDFEAELVPLRAFILPGGGQCGALLHLGRTVCRRAERSVVRMSKERPLNPLVIEYLNRLSDLLFVLARVANQRDGEVEIQW